MRRGLRDSKAGTDLHVTLGHVQRGNASMGKAASNDTTEHALGVVCSIVRHRAGETSVPLSRGHGGW